MLCSKSFPQLKSRSFSGGVGKASAATTPPMLMLFILSSQIKCYKGVNRATVSKQGQEKIEQHTHRQHKELGAQISGVAGIQTIPYKGNGMGTCFGNGNENPHDCTAPDESGAYFIRLFIIPSKENEIKDAHQQQRNTEEGDIGIHPHLIWETKALPKDGKRHSNDDLKQLEQTHKEETRFDDILFADRKGHSIEYIVVFPSLHTDKKDAERGVEENYVVRVMGDKKHGGKQQENDGGGMGGKLDLFIQ